MLLASIRSESAVAALVICCLPAKRYVVLSVVGREPFQHADGTDGAAS